MKENNWEEGFLGLYNGLNLQQRTAVDATEGPVMVIAGPGTGKTQILGARIGKILTEGLAGPENILCLTYTDAGVVAMRKRLLKFIGPDAYKIGLYTFHAFCNEVIQDNPEHFKKNALDPISELETIELFRLLIDGLQEGNPLKRYRGDVYFEINNLRSLFANMKKEGWNQEDIYLAIDRYIKELPSKEGFYYKKKYKDFKAGDPKQAEINEAVRKMDKLKAAVGEFGTYLAMMEKRGRYDFDDMINWVIEAFSENQDLLRNYQERFQYVMVDEYQDTSGTQNKIVELLMGFWEVPNIFVVGDDDQSIYRFQGANIENMSAYAERYRQYLRTVVLTENYRSAQPILDISMALIANNRDRLVNQLPSLSKQLNAARMGPGDGNNVSLLEYLTPKDEMMGTVLRIRALIEEGVAPARIAVIYRENKHGDEMAAFLRAKDLPYSSKRHQNLFDIPLAKKILLLLRYLDAEHDAPFGGEGMLFELLHAEWFKVPPIEIALASVEVAEKAYSSDKTYLRKWIIDQRNQPPKDLFSKPRNPALGNAATVLEELMVDTARYTLQQLFAAAVSKAGILGHVMGHPEKPWLLEVINALFDFVKEETRRNPRLDLHGLIRILDLMETEDIRLPIVRITGTAGGVNLLTAHGSKGLEFNHVFLIGCVSKQWEKKRKPGGGYALPDTLFDAASAGPATEEEELRRLFYVALTRAEERLCVSLHAFDEKAKPLEASLFVEEIIDGYPIHKTPCQVPAEAAQDFSALAIATGFAPEIGKPEDETVDRLLDGFAMNVTALNNYLDCPLRFYYNNLIKVPSAKSEAIEFGSAVHYSLEQLFKKMLADSSKQFPPLAVFQKDFEWYLHRHREFFTKEQYDRRLEYGRKILSDYYGAYLPGFNKVVSIERFIRNVSVKGVPLKGKLDKLEFDGNIVTVVDYKTGKVETAKDKLSPPNDKQPLGGDYWRQAVFYKLLIDNYEQKGWSVRDVVFDFIEPDTKNEYHRKTVSIGPADAATVSEQIVTVWNKIMAKEFFVGCGKPDCHWCEFVKSNGLAIGLRSLDEETEGED